MSRAWAAALLAALCASAALPAARAACRIDIPLGSSSRMGVGGVFRFPGSIPWPIFSWTKSPVTPSVRVTFPWSGSCNFTSSTVISSLDPNWVAAAAGSQIVSTPVLATAEMFGKYGGFRRRYRVEFTVSGFQFQLASGPSYARVSTRGTPVRGLTSATLAGAGSLWYNIRSRWGLGWGSGSANFDLANRKVSSTTGCTLAFRPGPANAVALDCSKLKINLAPFSAPANGGNSTTKGPVTVKLSFGGYNIRGSAPITTATAA